MEHAYEPEVLKKVQGVELEIFRDFDALCRKHNLEYFGGGGTAIGAIRHQGFIPWDDDIDVGMLREDYEVFKSVAEKEYSDKYRIVDFEHDDTWEGMNLHWEKIGTVFDSKKETSRYKQRGIFLDIFCYDNLANEERDMKRQAFLAWFWGKLLILSQVGTPVLYQKGIMKVLILICCRIIHFFFKACRIKRNFFYNKAKYYATQYNGIETSRVSFMFDPKPYTSIMKREDVFPVLELPFENTIMKFPKNIKKYLTLRFGDYMKMPAEEDRHNHAPEYISFGKDE